MFFLLLFMLYIKPSLFCKPNVIKEQLAKKDEVKLSSLQCTRSFLLFVLKLWIKTMSE